MQEIASGLWGQTEAEGSEQYTLFKGKFKPKLTTDDFYTPEAVYEAVKNWAVKEYGLEGREIIRPFYPGGDYERESYPEGCVVIDNPTFSILSKIVRFYNERGISFFLFAPTMTLFSTGAGSTNYLPCGAKITYENGAVINTSFVTSLGEYRIDTAPELSKAIEKAQENGKPEALPVYDYPANVVSAAQLQHLANKGADIKIRQGVFIRALESQREKKKTIFGAGFLISDEDAARIAAEKAAAEKAAAEKAKIFWPLSEAEREAIRRLGAQESAGRPGGSA